MCLCVCVVCVRACVCVCVCESRGLGLNLTCSSSFFEVSCLRCVVLFYAIAFFTLYVYSLVYNIYIQYSSRNASSEFLLALFECEYSRARALARKLSRTRPSTCK